MGDRQNAPLRVDFDHQLKLEFHGSTVTSDAGLLAYRELDDALRLTTTAADGLLDTRTGRNLGLDTAISMGRRILAIELDQHVVRLVCNRFGLPGLALPQTQRRPGRELGSGPCLVALSSGRKGLSRSKPARGHSRGSTGARGRSQPALDRNEFEDRRDRCRALRLGPSLARDGFAIVGLRPSSDGFQSGR
jgi:hypothetical protein